MIIKSISNQEAFKILDESMNKTYYGGNQEWYRTEWQRTSYCGPTTVANIIKFAVLE